MLATEAVLRFEGIGAPWRLDTPEPLAPPTVAAVRELVDRYDRTWSRFRDDSLVTRISREPGAWRLPPEAEALQEIYEALYEATDGAMSPLVGARLAALGYDRAYSLRPSGETSPVPSWDDTVSWRGRDLATVRPVTIDVGAAGKGQLVDLVSDLLVDSGHPSHVVDASGDLRVRQWHRPFRVALEHPRDPRRAIGVIELTDGALCASATNRRAWGDGLHHVLDATTGLPTASVVATWVTAPTALVADAVATALFFADADRIPYETEHVRMRADGSVDASPGLEGALLR